MEIEQITTGLLEAAFKQWHQAQEPPVALLALDLLRCSGLVSAAERSIQLYDYLANLVTQQLALQRQAERLTLQPSLPIQRQALLTDLAQDFSVGNANLEGWSLLYHRYLAPVPLSIQELAKGANVEERQIRRRLELGLRLLVDLVRRAEKMAHEHEQANYKRRYLPPAEHSRLFGLEQPLAHLGHSLCDPTQAPFVSLEGLGGIGKTTLARAVADHLALQTHFADILWAQAKSQQINERGELKPLANAPITGEGILAQLAAQLGVTEFWGMTLADLQARLRAIWANHPYLVVIDNLETVKDANQLLPILHAIAGQSRFLLTSRHTLRYYPFVYAFNVPELSLSDSLALMRYEIHRKQNCPAPTDAMLSLIYDAIGGLPLAIRLVTAQIGRLPLATILLDLRQARTQMPESMYTYIYRRAWRLLSDPAKHLLLSMLFVDPAGEEASWIGNMSAYPLCKVQQILAELMDYSLVEMDGALEQPLYKLHRLTHTFLQTQILAEWESAHE